MRRLSALVSACVLMAACGSSTSHTSAGSSTSTPPSSSRPTPSTCAHSPIARSRNSYYGLPAPKGPSIDFLASHAGGATNDGHGNAVRIVGVSIEKSGRDGKVTLTPGSSGDDVVLRGVGDFDGDGRGDLLVDLYKGGRVVATYIVSGTVAAGVHDPAVVGIRVQPPRYEAGAFAPFPEPVGDQNGDGADDVAFGPLLYSGRELTARRVASTPQPMRKLSSPYVGLLQLVANGPPTFVVEDRATSSLAVLDARSDRLLLNATATDVETANANGARAAGWLVNGHHIVEYRYSTRGGDSAWRWDLDAACNAR